MKNTFTKKGAKIDRQRNKLTSEEKHLMKLQGNLLHF